MVNVSALHTHPLSRSGLGSSKMFALAGMSPDLSTCLFAFDMKEKAVRIYFLLQNKSKMKYGFDCISMQCNVLFNLNFNDTFTFNYLRDVIIKFKD